MNTYTRYSFALFEMLDANYGTWLCVPWDLSWREGSAWKGEEGPTL